MTREDLEQLSKAQLIDLVLRQHGEIEALQQALTFPTLQPYERRNGHHLPAAMQVLWQSTPHGHNAEASHQVERALRHALEHLDDLAYLEHSELAGLIFRLRGEWPSGRALQQALVQAIRAIEPARGSTPRKAQYLHYAILYLMYIEQKKSAEVAQSLAISEQQYCRELKEILHLMAEVIVRPDP